MKRSKLYAIGLLIATFVLFFVLRPTRERACPVVPTGDGTNAPKVKAMCDEQGGNIVDGECTCPSTASEVPSA